MTQVDAAKNSHFILEDSPIDDVGLRETLGAEQLARCQKTHSDVFDDVLLTSYDNQCEPITGRDRSKRLTQVVLPQLFGPTRTECLPKAM